MFISTVPCQRCREPPGTSESNPIVLRDATSEEFADLLWVFYNPEYSNYSATLEKWKRILALAHQWGFAQVKKLCARELENLTIPPLEKIKVYQDFNLDPELLYDSYVELVTRPEPLTLEEGKKLEFLTSLKITHARELARASLGPDRATSSSGSATIQLQESEIQLAIKDIFRLWESAPTPMPPPPQPTTTDRQHPTSDDHVNEIVPQTGSASQRADIFGLQGSASTPVPSPLQPATTDEQIPTNDDYVDEVVLQARSQSQRSASRAMVPSDVFVQGLTSAPVPSSPQPTTTDRQNLSSDDHVDEVIPQTQSASQQATISDILLEGPTSAPTPSPPQPRATSTARQNPTRGGRVDQVVPRTRGTTVSSVVTTSVIGGRVPVRSQARRASGHPFLGFIAMLPMLILFVFALSCVY